MTDKAAKVLALLSSGRMSRYLSEYQWRSIPALIREGYVRELKCGACAACRCGCTCDTYAVVPTER